MSNPKNPNKNRDPSNNKNINLIITFDTSKNSIKNPIFPPLQDSKKENNDLNNKEESDNIKTDINSNTVLFTMKINSVLNELRKNREENDKTKSDNYKKIITASLDKTFKTRNDNTKNLSLVPFKKPKNENVSKTDINEIIRQIQNKYNLIYKDTSSNDVKSVIKPKRILKHTGTQFPPPPPPQPPNKFGSLFIQGRRPNSWNVGNNKGNSVNWTPNESWKGWDKKWSPPSTNIDKKIFPSLPPTVPPPLSIKKTKVVIEPPAPLRSQRSSASKSRKATPTAPRSTAPPITATSWVSMNTAASPPVPPPISSRASKAARLAASRWATA